MQKGSKAIFIFAPYTFKRHLKDGTEEEGIGFFAMPVFDISSTKVVMDDAPVIGLEQIDVPVENYATIIQAIIDAAPCPVSFEEFDGTANGYYTPSVNTITVRSSLPESMRIKTLLHEIAHSHLDNPANHQNDAVKDARNIKEIRAESIAFMVSSMLNIQTDDYSFPYIASWEMENNTKQLNAEMQLIKTTAIRIFEDIQKARGMEITPVKEVNT